MKIVPEFLFVESMSVTYYKVFPTLPVHWVLVIDFGLRQLRKIWLFRIPSFCAESSSKQRFAFQQLVSSEALNWHVKGKTSDFNFLLIASLSRSSRSQILHRFGLIFEVLEKRHLAKHWIGMSEAKKGQFHPPAYYAMTLSDWPIKNFRPFPTKLSNMLKNLNFILRKCSFYF